MSRALEVVAGVHRRAPFGVALTLDDASSDVVGVLHALDARVTFFLDDVDPGLVERLRRAGHGVGWRTERAHDELVRLDGRVTKLHRPERAPSTFGDAVRLRRRRLDPWLWSIEEADIDRVRDRDVVRIVDDLARVVAVVRARGLEPVVL